MANKLHFNKVDKRNGKKYMRINENFICKSRKRYSYSQGFFLLKSWKKELFKTFILMWACFGEALILMLRDAMFNGNLQPQTLLDLKLTIQNAATNFTTKS